MAPNLLISSVTIVSSCVVRRVRSFGDLGEDIILPGRVGVLAVVRGFGYRRQIRSYTYIFGCKRSRRWLILLLDHAILSLYPLISDWGLLF